MLLKEQCMFDEIVGEKKVCIKRIIQYVEYTVMELSFNTHFFSCNFY